MGSNGFPRTPSVLFARAETIDGARRYCARQSQERGWTVDELRDVLLALGLDETARVSEDVRVQDLRLSWM